MVLVYQYVTYTDVFRIIPYRWMGYGYTMMKMLNMHQQFSRGCPDVGCQEEYSCMSSVTLLYMAGHAFLHSTVASADASSPQMSHCGLAVRAAYVWMSVLESVAWDLLASVVLPYVQGFILFQLLDGLVLCALDYGNPLRLYLPGTLAAFSVPCAGPAVDVLVDYLLNFVSRKFRLCPKPVFYSVWLASNTAASVTP